MLIKLQSLFSEWFIKFRSVFICVCRLRFWNIIRSQEHVNFDKLYVVFCPLEFCKFCTQSAGNGIAATLDFKIYRGAMPPDPLEVSRLRRSLIMPSAFSPPTWNYTPPSLKKKTISECPLLLLVLCRGNRTQTARGIEVRSVVGQCRFDYYNTSHAGRGDHVSHDPQLNFFRFNDESE